MRIGIDARFLGAAHSALARYSESLLLALARVDTPHEYVVYVHANLDRRLKLDDRFRLERVRGNPIALRSMLRLERRLRRESLDLLHVHFPMFPPAVECPVLLTVHDMVPFRIAQGEFSRLLRPWRWLWPYLIHPRALKRATWVMCVSHTTRRQLIELFPGTRHKSIVVHSGVNAHFRGPLAPATVDLIRSRLKLPSRYLLYSGSARSDKNLVGMLRAFALLLQSSPHLDDLHFILEISGEASCLQPIERLAHQYGIGNRVRIILNAGGDERHLLFQEGQALLQISRGEGFCFPLLDAQASSLPVIASDDGAIPEIAGEGVVLVDPDNQEGIASMIERVLSDEELRAFLVKKGNANVRRFDWNQSAKQLLQIYDLMVGSIA